MRVPQTLSQITWIYHQSRRWCNIDQLKVRAIIECKAPTSVKVVISFLRFSNFYRCFVDKFWETITPLVNLTNSRQRGDGDQRRTQNFCIGAVFNIMEPGSREYPGSRLFLVCPRWLFVSSRLAKRLRPVAYHSQKLSSTEGTILFMIRKC